MLLIKSTSISLNSETGLINAEASIINDGDSDIVWVHNMPVGVVTVNKASGLCIIEASSSQAFTVTANGEFGIALMEGNDILVGSFQKGNRCGSTGSGSAKASTNPFLKRAAANANTFMRIELVVPAKTTVKAQMVIDVKQ